MPDAHASRQPEADAERLAGARGLLVARVGMARDAEAGVAVEHRLQPLGCERRAVRDRRLPGAHHAADVGVHRDEVRAGGAGEQRVQHRPVGDGVAAVVHLLGLAERARHRTGIEVVARERYRRGDLPARDRLVYREREAAALAVAEPADARGQSLELHVPARELQPAHEAVLRREELRGDGLGGLDVARVAGHRYPAERADAAAEERPDEQRDEGIQRQRLGVAGVRRPHAQRVAVLEDERAPPAELHQRARMAHQRFVAAAQRLGGIGLTSASISAGVRPEAT